MPDCGCKYTPYILKFKIIYITSLREIASAYRADTQLRSMQFRGKLSFINFEFLPKVDIQTKYHSV